MRAAGDAERLAACQREGQVRDHLARTVLTTNYNGEARHIEDRRRIHGGRFRDSLVLPRCDHSKTQRGK
jgi:hypothetical protein